MAQNKFNLLTSSEAATILGFTPDYVRQLIRTDHLKAMKIGRIWLINPKDLTRIKRKRFPAQENLVDG